MLLDNPAVTDGHLETTENRHPCSEFLVKVVKNSALGRIHQRQNLNRAHSLERDGRARSANKRRRLSTAPCSPRTGAIIESYPDGCNHHGWPGAERASDAGAARQRR